MKKEEINYLYQFYPSDGFEYFLKLLQERSETKSFLHNPTKEQVKKAVQEGYTVSMQMILAALPTVIGSAVEISIEDENFYSRAKKAVSEYIDSCGLRMRNSVECCSLISLTCFDRYLTMKRKQESFFEYTCKGSRMLSLVEDIKAGDFDAAITYWLRSNTTE